MGQTKRLSQIADAMPLGSSDKASVKNAVASGDLSNPETVHRFAGQATGSNVGNFAVNNPKNMYTQQGASSVNIPQVSEKDDTPAPTPVVKPAPKPVPSYSQQRSYNRYGGNW